MLNSKSPLIIRWRWRWSASVKTEEQMSYRVEEREMEEDEERRRQRRLEEAMEVKSLRRIISAYLKWVFLSSVYTFSL